MGIYRVFIIVTGLLLTSGAATGAQVQLSAQTVSFTENQGQWPDSILFRAESGPVALWFTSTGAYYQFTRLHTDRHGTKPAALTTQETRLTPDSVEFMMVKAALVGGNPQPKAVGEDPAEYRCNFFLGNDPVRWRGEVMNYGRILLTDVYPGVDLVYRGVATADQSAISAPQAIEYDFHVAAGADYEQIRIRYEGARALTINDSGALVITTAWGEIREKAPVVYQQVKGTRTVIEAEFVLTGELEFGFRLGAGYDNTQPVIIDPVLVYGTFLGGSNRELGQAVEVAADGSIYVTGTTYSANFPTANPYDGTLTGSSDIFITKFSPDGSSLAYSTYLGGNGADYGHALALHSSGTAYMAGQSFSTNFPTANAWLTDPDLAGGGSSGDAVVTKLSATGNSLLFSTYIGGTNIEYAWGIAVADDGTAFVTGYTYSSNFPTVNAFQTYQGNADAFVASIPSAGGTAAYSTCLGGESTDFGRAIAVDAAGAAYITGNTQSTTFPTVNPFQIDQQAHDAFVAKIVPGGDSLAYATYLGGSAYDDAMGIAVDDAGSAYVAGRTYSSDFPTRNPFQTNRDTLDAFIVKMAPDGSSLAYGTYLGGNDLDEAWAIAVDNNGAAFITGNTYSTDFPLVGEFQSDQWTVDAFMTKLSPNGRTLLSSTYLGGSLVDLGTDIAVDTSGSVYVTGYTWSDNFPTINPYQSVADSVDLFVVKFDLACCVGVRGNADGDAGENLNVSDITFLIATVFRGGAMPDCYEEGDANGDGGLNVADISYLIATVFRGGPLPAPCP